MLVQVVSATIFCTRDENTYTGMRRIRLESRENFPVDPLLFELWEQDLDAQVFSWVKDGRYIKEFFWKDPNPTAPYAPALEGIVRVGREN